MAHLSLSLLGSFEASLDGQLITSFKSDKVRALLAYLAIEADRPHRRETLAALLWPDWPEAYARSSLRSALANLRQAIGDHEAEPPYLLITYDTIQFNPESDHALDVAALLEGPASERAGQSVLERLRQGIELYRGDFLEGFSIADSAPFEEWAAQQREHLRELALGILHHLASQDLERGDPQRAESYARRSLELDPWDEEAHRQLMCALALGGSRSAALAQYEACRRALAEGLAVKPEAQTVALYEQIRDGTLAGPEVQREAMAIPVAPFSEHRREPMPEERPLFVGRQGELDQLSHFLDTALAGHGRVVFVTGEPGSGKTALVQEFTRRCLEAHDDLVLATGKCNGLIGVGDPYLPFIQILQMLTGDIEAEWLAGSITQEHVRRLWSLVPGAVEALLRCGQDLLDRFVPGGALLGRLQTCAPSGDASPARLRAALEHKAARPSELQQPYLFEQYTRVLQALAQERPLVLVVDDLQWADTGSIGLLFHLGRRLEGHPLLLLGIYRPEDVSLGREGERHPLEPVVSELQRAYGPIHVDLDRADGREFLQALLDSEPNRLGSGFREMLYHYAGGQPLFTLELLRGLQERGDLLRDAQGRWLEGPSLNWDRLPSRVEAVIGERIARLPPELQETLSLASVEGETFTAQVIARVQDADERTIIGRLSGPLSKEHRLVVAQSVSRVGAQPLSRYRFHHHLLQTYLYEHLDPVERAYLHGEVGDALHELCGGRAEAMVNLAPQLGWHYREAGRAGEASEHLYQAGVQAERLSAPQEALRYFQQALELVEEDRVRDQILSARARLLADLFRGREAAEDYEQLLAHARRGGDGQGELAALLGLARAHYIMALDARDPGIVQKSRELYEAAYELARARGDKAAMARALIPTDWFQDFWPEYRDQAAANVRQALALSQEVGDEALVIAATMALFQCQSIQERERGAEGLLVRLLKEGDLLRAKELYFKLMWSHLLGGDFLRCVECCDAGIELAARIGVPPVQYPTLKALALLQLGRYDAAWQALQGEVADEEHPFGRAFQSLGLGMYLLELAAYGKASEAFESLIEQSERLGRAWLKARGQVALAQSLVQVRPLDEARLQAIAQDLVNVRETLADRIVGIALSAIALAIGNPQEALQEAQKAAAEAQENGARLTSVAALELELRALLDLNRPAEALPLAEEAIRLATEMGYRPMEWRLHAAKAQALGRLGETDAAAQEYERAAAILRELADTIADAELRRGFLADPLAASVIKGAGPTKDE